MKKSNKKTLVLSIVAFVLILMSLVSFTYSWIDDIKLVEFQNDNLVQNGAPLKTGTDINATVNITKNDNTIRSRQYADKPEIFRSSITMVQPKNIRKKTQIHQPLLHSILNMIQRTAAR